MWFRLASFAFASSLLHAADPPRLEPSNIVSAADHRGGRISPGEIVVLYPENAGPDVLFGQQLDERNRVAETLNETRVYFGGIAAPMAYTVRGELGAVVPYEIAGKNSVDVVVEYQGQRSEPVQIPVVPSNPAIFTQNRVGTGQAGILHDTGCCNSAENPAVRGSVVTLYATGEGLLAGRVPTGSVSAYSRASAYPRPALPVQLTVGGIPARLVFVGAAPHAVAGLLQVNFVVPLNAPAGDAVPLVLTVGSAASSAVATMAVREIKDQVLITEPDSASRRSLERILAGAGYRVYIAASREEALAQVRAHPIDLMVFALNGDQAQQREWVDELRGLRSRLKVVARLDAVDSGSLRAADFAGAQAVISGPLDASTVLQRVRELIRRRSVAYDAGPAWPFPDARR